MKLTRLALALPFVLACRPAAADDAPYAKQMEAKAASVVYVKFVQKMQMMGRQGGGQEREQNRTAMGLIVDAAGVVMMSGEVGGGRGRGFGAVPTSPPTNLRVVFEGDVKEYEAILGATDSKLGLTFLRVKDLGDKKVVPVDLASTVEPKVGDELFGVARLPQGFDYAPFYGVTHLVGQVTKPRTMWLLNGFAAVALPLYDAQGKTAGIVVRQSGVSDGEEQGPGPEQSFLLPVKAAAPTIAQAVKQCAEALEKSKAQAKEATDEGGAAMGDAPAKPPDAAPGMN